MSPSPTPRVAVIGAGLTGLACARRLHEAGLAPLVLEKSRGLGGRLATRRTAEGDRYDHGAQFVTARDPGFRRQLQQLATRGAVRSWAPALPPDAPRPVKPWWIGTPGMKGLVEPLADGLAVRCQARVEQLQREERTWWLVLEDGERLGPFDLVAVTAPAPQARALLESAGSRLARALAAVEIAPCWALLLEFEAPWALPFDAGRLDGGPVAWIARQASRPGLAGGAHRWVVHASAPWSAAHLEESPDEVVARLLAALPAQLGGAALPPRRFAQAHRWRHAMTLRPLGHDLLGDPFEGLWAGGDWCLGARVEHAWLSGQAIAAAMLARSRSR